MVAIIQVLKKVRLRLALLVDCAFVVTDRGVSSMKNQLLKYIFIFNPHSAEKARHSIVVLGVYVTTRLNQLLDSFDAELRVNCDH